MRDLSGEWDVIIVGAGSAGSVVAARLSEDPGLRVLLVEAGPSDNRFWIRTPAGYGMTYTDPTVNWCYETEPDPEVGGRRSYWPRGKVVGGSGSINAMVWVRGQAADFDDWEAAGNPGWGWADVAPVFDRIEDRTGGHPDRIGITVPERELHPLRQVFDRAAHEVGWTTGEDISMADTDRTGAWATSIRDGRRSSSAAVFLRPAMARPNLRVVLETDVLRVDFEGRRAVGITLRGEQKVRAQRAVILCAGAVNSPKLLMQSGVGPGDHLREMGNAVVFDNPHVGGHMQDHVGVSYYYRSRVPTLNSVLGTRAGRWFSGARYLLTRRGPLAMSVNQMGGFIRGGPERRVPNIQLYFNPISFVRPSGEGAKTAFPSSDPGFLIGHNSCRPVSEGRISLRSGDPMDRPVIAPNALTAELDIAEAIEGSRLVARLQETEAFRAVTEGVSTLDPAKASDADLLADFRERCGTVFHPCCTCRMAPDAISGVIGGDMAVHGVEGLFVVDASAFPNITSGNINAPTVMLAEKGSSHIRERLRAA